MAPSVPSSSSAIPHVTVIPSSNPRQDAECMRTLLPNILMELEESEPASASGECASTAVCLCRSETPDCLLLFLAVDNSQQELPTSTIVPIVCSQQDIEMVVALMGEKEMKDNDGSALLQCTKTVDTDAAAADSSTLALFRLPSKLPSSILLIPPLVANSPKGRALLTQILTFKSLEHAVSSDTLQTEVSATTSSTSGEGETMEDVSLADERQCLSVTSTSPPDRQERDDSYPSARFPSLSVRVLQKSGAMTNKGYPINPQHAVPVETDLFKGRMLMLTKPLQPEDDPYWNELLFSKRKRRFVFQLQGKFKRVPKGTLYAGGEISNPMQLGLVTRGICGLLLKFIRAASPDTHYSFGDNKEEKEMAHIVVPAWTFFERLIVTPPGEEPPKLTGNDDDLPESKESMVARKNGKSRPHWNTSDTYSMSFYTMYLDFAKWQVVQVPVTSDLDLKTFWGNSFLRIVLFENETPPKDGRHLVKDNTYYFSVELRHISKPHKRSMQDEVVVEEEDDEIVPMPWEKPRSGSFRLLQHHDRKDSGSSLHLADDDDLFFDAEEEEDSSFDAEEEKSAPNTTTSNTITTRPAVGILSTIDSVCPALMEIFHKGKYVKTYAFNLQSMAGRTVFRTASCVEELFATSKAKHAADEMWSPRMSSSERCRRILGQTIAKGLMDGSDSGVARLKKFARNNTLVASGFLHRADPSWTTRKQRHKIRQSGYGARALNDRHWMEEWIQITDRHILFYNPEKHKVHFRISLHSVVDVRCLPPAEAPFMLPYSFISIATLGRIVYVMFPMEIKCQEWVDLINGLITMNNSSDGPSSWDAQSISSDHSVSFDEPAHEFMQESSLWNCKQRRILNGRTLSFHSRDSQTKDPSELVQVALVRALEQTDEFDENSMIDFLDSAAALKDMDVYSLDETTRLAFFLNLYHTMIMHAFLVLGPPDSTFKSISYFNTISYQVSDDIFSLTELEHCIIRAAMNYPSQFVSKFVLPKSKYLFALSRPDYRINFALNCGSISTPEVVPIYKTARLDEQLDGAARCYMDYTSDVRRSSRRGGGVTLTLPRVLQWFSEDFGNGSTNDVVKCVERFLKDGQRDLVASCYSRKEQHYNFSDLHVKYGSFSFECRNLKLA